MSIKHIAAHSVNEALSHGLYHLAMFGVEESSRNGPVFVSQMPVLTTYYNPMNRVLVNTTRDANPFFHLFEALWMLAGRNDLALPQKFVSTFGQFSDDGETLWGAYGYRWREHFGYDQLNVIVKALTDDPKTRRAVLTMWDGVNDLERAESGGKDVPCNTQAYFDTLGGYLNMTVTCRSNDIVWGAYGANAVHFSFLLEYVSSMTGIPMGVYRQFSNNYHAYQGLVGDRRGMEALAQTAAATCPYSVPGVLRQRSFDQRVIEPLPLFGRGQGEARAWHEDLRDFMDGYDTEDFETAFFRYLVGPMYLTWSAWKKGEFEEARHLTLSIRPDDWRMAAQDWLSIRELRRKESANV